MYILNDLRFAFRTEAPVEVIFIAVHRARQKMGSRGRHKEVTQPSSGLFMSSRVAGLHDGHLCFLETCQL